MPQSDLEHQQAALAQGIKNDMLKTAAAQTAIQIGLMFVPVVGWALGAILAVVQVFTARANKKELQGVIDKLQRDLAALKKKYEQKYEAEQDHVYEAERTAAVTDIKAGKSMAIVPVKAAKPALNGWTGGLGWGGFSSISHAVTSAISHAVHDPVKIAISTGMKLTAGAASAVGAKALSTDIKRSEKQFKSESDRSSAKMEDRLRHPYKVGKDFEQLGRVVAGTEAVHQARIAAREFLATAEKDMAEQVAIQTKILHSVPFRQNLRNALVTRMNEDPAFRKLMFTLPSTLKDPLGASVKEAHAQMTGLATMGAVGAAALAFFKLKH